MNFALTTDASFEHALAWAGVGEATGDAREHEHFAREGYVILRGTITAEMLEPLREMFERQILANDQWPFPREAGARFAMLDDDPLARRACLLPRILAATLHLLRRPFFFSDIQGRDPLLGGGWQRLHRDWLVDGASHTVISGFGFLDDFDAENGATCVVPRTHRHDEPFEDMASHPDQIVVKGKAGDVLLFDSRLIHCGTVNVSGRPRRSLHFGYRARDLRAGFTDRRKDEGLCAEERVLMGIV